MLTNEFIKGEYAMEELFADYLNFIIKGLLFKCKKGIVGRKLEAWPSLRLSSINPKRAKRRVRPKAGRSSLRRMYPFYDQD